ncbi:unnamed protein product [Ectocarpus sp. CCAP 1310/34]|nr:unnamed protein product [Ectocarpus sp. CCAP 1310/34]
MVRLRCFQPVVGLIVILLLCCNGSAKKSKRWTYPRPQWPVPGHRMDAVPCRWFLWDVASAARFCECTRHLESVADQTLWEDSHGQLWLRVPFSSPLLRLFPCQQHSLTRCAKCGHEYRAHVEHTLKRRKDGDYDKFIRDHARRVGGRGAQDYRGGSVFSDQKRTSRERVDASVGSLGSSSGNGNNSGASNANGGTSSGGIGNGSGWRRRLAVLAEAQRAALLQTSGIAVTSETARSAFKAVHDEKVKAGAAQEKRENKRRRRGDGGVATAAGKRTTSRRVREDLDAERYGDGGGLSDRGGGARRGSSRSSRNGGGGRGSSSRRKGETEDEVALRHLRAFDRIEYI